MKIEMMKVSDLVPYENNPRDNSKAIPKVVESLKEFGWQQPIVIDKDKVVIAGHTRLEAAKSLGMDSVPCVVASDLTPDQVRAYRLADNKTAEFSKWNIDALLEESKETKLDLSRFGFDPNSISKGYTEFTPGALKEDFVVPPFSVLNCASGDWQKRKKEWAKVMDSHAGRVAGLTGSGLEQIAKKQGQALDGTSVFDPVLTEIMIHWFAPAAGSIIDPFAGGPTRGEVASFLGRRYTGVDLRPEQIDANENEWAKVEDAPADFYGGGSAEAPVDNRRQRENRQARPGRQLRHASDLPAVF